MAAIDGERLKPPVADDLDHPAASGDRVAGSGPRGNIAGYSAVMAAYGLAAGAAALAVSRRGRGDVARQPSWTELAMLGLATHRISRLVSKSKITTPIRAPFSRFEGYAGPSEVNDVPTGSGWRRSVGELLSCPFCLDVWTASAIVVGRSLLPRATQTVVNTAATVAVADLLHFAYVMLEHRAEPGQ